MNTTKGMPSRITADAIAKAVATLDRNDFLCINCCPGEWDNHRATVEILNGRRFMEPVTAAKEAADYFDGNERDMDFEQADGSGRWIKVFDKQGVVRKFRTSCTVMRTYTASEAEPKGGGA